MNTNTKRNSRKKSTNPLDSHIEQYVSELRASGRPLGAEAFSEAVRTFSQRFVEAMLQGEMDAHLTGCQPTETPPEEVDADELSLVPNKRNGFSHKTLKTEFGPLPLSVPRDRRNTFDPIIGECQDFCVWGGYSRGSPTRLPFVFEMQYARPDAIAGAKVEGPARSAGGSSLAPAIARREAAGALAREV